MSDITRPKPGGLHAVALATGERAWFTPPPPPTCGTGRGCNGGAVGGVTAIPGAVFSGSNDGALRAYSTADGAILWEFDTNREFEPSTACRRRARRCSVPGPVVAGGMVYVNSGTAHSAAGRQRAAGLRPGLAYEVQAHREDGSRGRRLHLSCWSATGLASV